MEAVRELLLRGAAVNTADIDGVSPLIVASQNGHLRVVRELLAFGAAPGVVANNGATALNRATDKGHPAIVQLLRAALKARKE